MLFCFNNALGTFERAMDVISLPVKLKHAFVHLEAIVVFSGYLRKHIAKVRQMLNLIINVGSLWSGGNVSSFQSKLTTIDYLDLMIRPRRLKIFSHATHLIKELKLSKNITELRLSFGLCNVFRRFLHNFGPIAAPLNRELQKDQLEEFGDLTTKETAPMEELQATLVSPLALPLL